MAGFLFALLGVIATSFGGRDQLLLARLGTHAPATLLAAGWASTLIASVAVALAGGAIEATMPPAPRTVLVAIALLFAAVALWLPVRAARPAEPTRSLGALFVVLLARQLTDAPRFLIFALAIAHGWLAALGGALAGVAGLTAGWMAGSDLERLPLATIRRGLGVVLLLAALFMLLRGLG